MAGRTPPTILMTLAALVCVSCAHVAPYYRYDQPRFTPIDPKDTIEARLLMVGDAGDPARDGEPVLQLLSQQARALPDRSTIVFLGDNVYERGMPKEDNLDALTDINEASKLVLPDFGATREEAERCLNSQIDVVRGTDIPAVFIPGNHDWDQFELHGWERILEQGKFIDAARAEGNNVWLLPAGGCPGPVSIPIGKRGMLIVLDTQWWLETRTDGKPTPTNNPTGCLNTTEEQVQEALMAQLEIAAREGRRAIVAGHHPLESNGPHGGFVEGIVHLFPLRFVRHYIPAYMEWLPLPGLGTMAVLGRQYFSPSAQDFSNSRNEHFRSALRGTMAEAETRKAPALVYAAGHDHTLQVLRTQRGPHYAIVSGVGAASRASAVGASHNTLFCHANGENAGFMQLDFYKSGSVVLSVIEVSGEPKLEDAKYVTGDLVYSLQLAKGRAPKVSRWQRWRQRFLRPKRQEDSPRPITPFETEPATQPQHKH